MRAHPARSAACTSPLSRLLQGRAPHPPGRTAGGVLSRAACADVVPGREPDRDRAGVLPAHNDSPAGRAAELRSHPGAPCWQLPSALLREHASHKVTGVHDIVQAGDLLPGVAERSCCLRAARARCAEGRDTLPLSGRAAARRETGSTLQARGVRWQAAAPHVLALPRRWWSCCQSPSWCASSALPSSSGRWSCCPCARRWTWTSRTRWRPLVYALLQRWLTRRGQARPALVSPLPPRTGMAPVHVVLTALHRAQAEADEERAGVDDDM